VRAVVVRGKNPATPRAQFSFPVAGGQHAAVRDGAPAFRRRRPPVERRPGFDERVYSDEDGLTSHNAPLWARPDATANPRRQHSLQIYLLTPMDRGTLLHVKSTISHCPLSLINRQRVSVDSKLLHTPRNIGYYRTFER